jgi:hypothetical protein
LLDRVASVIAEAARAPIEESPGRTGALGSRVVATDRAPGLSITVRRVRQPRLGEALLVDMHQWPIAPSTEASGTPLRGGYALPLKRVTLRIRVGGLPKSDRDRQRGARRRYEWWRFAPSAPDPLNVWVERLRARGKAQAAASLERSLGDLDPRVREARRRREPLSWRTVWIEPTKQTPRDIGFLLALVLVQERMTTDEERDRLAEEGVQYLREVHSVTPESCASEVFAGLISHFTEPEDWRALPAYVSRSAWAFRRGPRATPVPTASDSAAQEDGDDLSAAMAMDQQRTGRQANVRRRDDWVSPNGLTVDQAHEHLATEGWEVSQDSLYDWIRAGKVHINRERGRVRITDQGLKQARTLAQARVSRRVLLKGLIRQGRSSAAAKKLVQRRLKAGSSVAEQLNLLRSGAIRGASR